MKKTANINLGKIARGIMIAIIALSIIVCGICLINVMINDNTVANNEQNAVDVLYAEIKTYKLTPHPIQHTENGLSMDFADIGVFAPEFTEEPEWVQKYYEDALSGTTYFECGVATLLRTEKFTPEIRSEIWGLGNAIYLNGSAYTNEQYRALLDTLYQLCLNKMEET